LASFLAREEPISLCFLCVCPAVLHTMAEFLVWPLGVEATVELMSEFSAPKTQHCVCPCWLSVVKTRQWPFNILPKAFYCGNNHFDHFHLPRNWKTNFDLPRPFQFSAQCGNNFLMPQNEKWSDVVNGRQKNNLCPFPEWEVSLSEIKFFFTSHFYLLARKQRCEVLSSARQFIYLGIFTKEEVNSRFLLH